MVAQLSLKEGDRIGHYVVERRLGLGGFGITYLARDPSLNKRFAIKEYFPRELAIRQADGSVVPLDESHQEGFNSGLRRFLEEARTLARFDDPAIVSVFRILEVNDTPYKTAYIVMDFIDGETLSEKLKREKQIAAPEARRLLLKIADGLASVHEAGVLHRDIKPANILLRNKSEPVLIDFGAAKAAAHGDVATLTAIWTPGFGAKEQMSEAETEGPYTDVYGLSAVGYCMITGKRPLDAAQRFPVDTIDKLAPLAQTSLEKALFEAIDWGMLPYKEDRPPRLDDWSAAFRDVGVDADSQSGGSPASSGDAPGSSSPPPLPGGATPPPLPDSGSPDTGDSRSGPDSQSGGTSQTSQSGETGLAQPSDAGPSVNQKTILAASLLLVAAAIVIAVVVLGDFFPSGGSERSSNDDSQVVADNSGEQSQTETPSTNSQTEPTLVTQQYSISNARWTRISLPSAVDGQFAIAASGRYRLRVNGQLFVHPGGSTPMAIGAVSGGVVELKSVDASAQIELVYPR